MFHQFSCTTFKLKKLLLWNSYLKNMKRSFLQLRWLSFENKSEAEIIIWWTFGRGFIWSSLDTREPQDSRRPWRHRPLSGPEDPPLQHPGSASAARCWTCRGWLHLPNPPEHITERLTHLNMKGKGHLVVEMKIATSKKKWPRFLFTD